MERTIPLISHESPISLLPESLKYNDYDYCLVHLMEQEPEYKDFFLKSSKLGRRILLDTSIFELGEAFDLEKYAHWVKELTPHEYILPDVLEDSFKTIQNSESFIETYPDLPGKKIGVVQGKSFSELMYCYDYLDKRLNVDKIAISFDYSIYQEYYPHPNKWVSFMMGRVLIINKLLQDGILNINKPHHLLGCSNPLEFSFYKDPIFNFIESIDTSSPIVHGLHKVYYEGLLGDWQKQTTKLADLIKAVPDEAQRAAIIYNINTFRSYVS
jgi:hypothetical protein